MTCSTFFAYPQCPGLDEGTTDQRVHAHPLGHMAAYIGRTKKWIEMTFCLGCDWVYVFDPFLFHGMNFRHFLLVNVTHSVGISIFWERLSRIFSRVNEDRHHRVFTMGKPVANEVGQLPSAIFDGKLIKNRWVTTFVFLALVCQPFPLSCLGFAINCSVISNCL